MVYSIDSFENLLSTIISQDIHYKEKRLITNEILLKGLEEYKKHMARLIDLQTRTLSDSTEYIEILSTGTVVNNPEHVYEFYQNCDAEICKAVRERLEEINTSSAIPPLDTACQSCTKPYSVPLVFDYASFFADGS